MNPKQTGEWVRITYPMPALIEGTGRKVTLHNGSDVRVETYDRHARVYVVILKGRRYSVNAADLESNGPKALHDMFRLS